MKKYVPPELSEHILPFNWDVRRVWEQASVITQRPIADFDYLLDLPLWSSLPKQGMLFDISPREVMAYPERAPHQTLRIQNACIDFPIDLLHYQGSEWVLDGVHRIAKLWMKHEDTLNVRVHGEEIIPRIRIEEAEQDVTGNGGQAR
ncbi:hypothetical protein JIN85_19700 [Luteolibacter pohnpeiensis]|uniref:Uncharacterized protein n=1 Tax=Luteolibacter pohnpeiensis TaxID=454153 RepID=A0A934S7S4_9BACT|nr:hypothetical protein [Luteolibacter pohnpeiensis]MBK1884650.1 hypothetical protein [Luteolibacter pohnpeiensis]